MELKLIRKIYSDQSTLGSLFVNGEFECFTLERPREGVMKANPPYCIPAGTYPVKPRWSEHFQKNVLGVYDVPGRTDIEIHIGNFPTDVKGCIAVGDIQHADYVGNSRVAFEEIMRKTAIPEDIYIVIS